MKPLPTNQLDPRIKNVWRINDFIWITVAALGALTIVIPLIIVSNNREITTLLIALFVICYAAALVVFLVILPPIRYARWRYEISEDFLDIAKGIIWRSRYTIPFIRVQNTDTRQGPILRAFGLASVTVSTAAKEHVIPGLDFTTAEQLRDRAAELARLAREDV